MDELSVDIQLAGRNYSLRIKQGEAESIQKATEMVNKTLKDFESKYNIKNTQDLLAMASLQIASQLTDYKEPEFQGFRHLTENLSSIERILEDALPQN